MAYKKKYKKGLPIKSLEDILVLYRKKAFIFTHGRPYHYGWWSGWSIRYLSGQIKRKAIFYVEITGDEDK